MTTNQERMRTLLDQQAQQTRRRDNQASSSKTNKLPLRRWIGPKQNGSMRGRRRSA